MADEFDAYYMWLGIPPDEQPPDHYRLLGVRRFESNVDVIEAAADRQMGHVQRYKIGAHSALSQRLLNQLASAKICLLKTESKTEYDRQLRERTVVAASEPAVLPAATTAPTVPQPIVPRAAAPRRVVPLATAAPQPTAQPWAFEPSRPSRASPAPPRSMPPVALIAAGAAILIVVVGVAISLNSDDSAPEERSLVAREKPAASAKPAEIESATAIRPVDIAEPATAPPVASPAAVPEPPPAAVPAEPAPASVIEPPAKPTGPALDPRERAAAERFLQAGGRLSLLIDGLPGEASKIEDLPARCMIVGTIVVPESLRNDAGMETIREFSQLTHLNLEYSGVTDAGLSRLTNLKRLKAIGMYRAPVTDEGLKSLAQLASLEELTLNSTRITNAGLVHLKSLKKLHHLGLGEIPPITGEGLEHLRGLKELVSLDLNVTGVNDKALELLGTWTQLKGLNLFTTPITDAGLVHLYHLENLEATELGRTGATDAGVAALQVALPKCRIGRIP